MLQKANQLKSQHNKYKKENDELHISISNINQIMAKINQVVRKSQESLNEDDPCITFVTHQNLMTENLQVEDSDFVIKIKNKINNMKIPLHQLHKKNKLSTVVEQSQSQSGRTNQYNHTPRQLEETHNKLISKNNSELPVSKRYQFSGNNKQQPNLNQFQEQNWKPKKITGIRKTSNFKQHQNSSESKIAKTQSKNILRQQNFRQVQVDMCLQKITDQKQRLNTKQKVKQKDKQTSNRNFHKYSKSQSTANIKCSRLIESMFHRKKTAQDFIQVETKRSVQRNKKGLSLLSKRTIKSEENQKVLSNIQNTQNKAKTNQTLSSEKQAKAPNSISVKKRTIHPFLIPKKSVQMDKKIQNKTRNCLSRTNIRQFFVSKRINK